MANNNDDDDDDARRDKVAEDAANNREPPLSSGTQQPRTPPADLYASRAIKYVSPPLPEASYICPRGLEAAKSQPDAESSPNRKASSYRST